MCTVTYIPKQDGGFVLTSNRDEVVGRNAALPSIREYNGNRICFPREPQSGGSWIAINENGRICCLLNGAFERHEKQKYQTKSRGHILLGMTTSDLRPELFFEIENLHNVQPFTLITLEYLHDKVKYFSEMIWDGNEKCLRYPRIQESHIWSSSSIRW